MNEYLASVHFDEAQWIDAFFKVGGMCWLGTDGRVSVCWEVEGRSLEDQLEARRLSEAVFNHPQAFMRTRQLASLIEHLQVSAA